MMVYKISWFIWGDLINVLLIPFECLIIELIIDGMSSISQPEYFGDCNLSRIWFKLSIAAFSFIRYSVSFVKCIMFQRRSNVYISKAKGHVWLMVATVFIKYTNLIIVQSFSIWIKIFQIEMTTHRFRNFLSHEFT